jgi:hypothetical protein
LEITAWPDGTVSAVLIPPGGDPAPDLALVRRIVEYLSDYDGSSQGKIEENLDGKAALIRSALRWMAADERGWLRIEKKGAAHFHYLTAEGRDAFGTWVRPRVPTASHRVRDAVAWSASPRPMRLSQTHVRRRSRGREEEKVSAPHARGTPTDTPRSVSS